MATRRPKTRASDAAQQAGPLLIIGGAEDKLGRSQVLRRFVRAAGGGRADIVLVPTASAFASEMLDVYGDVFTRHGAARVSVVNPSSRLAADDPELLAPFETATGIFLTGGNQLKLSQWITGTGVGDAILAANARGAVVAGTSAGAGVMSTHMISMGTEGLIPRNRMSQLSAGLGLIDGVVVDQHFDQRNRYGRLMSVVASSPSLLGIGIDENTAALVTGRRFLEVVGPGGVFLVDAQYAVSDAHEARRGAPLMISGAVVHTLPAGATFDLWNRRLASFVERNPDPSMEPGRSEIAETTLLASRLKVHLHR